MKKINSKFEVDSIEYDYYMEVITVLFDNTTQIEHEITTKRICEVLELSHTYKEIYIMDEEILDFQIEGKYYTDYEFTDQQLIDALYTDFILPLVGDFLVKEINYN